MLLYVHYFNEAVRYSFDTILTTYHSMLKCTFYYHKDKDKIKNKSSEYNYLLNLLT